MTFKGLGQYMFQNWLNLKSKLVESFKINSDAIKQKLDRGEIVLLLG